MSNGCMLDIPDASCDNWPRELLTVTVNNIHYLLIVNYLILYYKNQNNKLLNF